jgi:UDP-2,4-diacetamido-2,4,6-trideoxy-beta-L-altropyranose hydrolase
MFFYLDLNKIAMNSKYGNLFIRVDAGMQIGDGHFLRCLTLVNELKNKFRQIIFISNELPKHFSQIIEKNNFKICRIDGYSHIQEEKIAMKLKKQLIQKDFIQTKKIIEKHKNSSNYLIVDHYGIDYVWEKNIRENIEKVIVIDDLANRKHDCDILFDQNFYEDMEKRYSRLIPNFCKQFLGPKFALLRPEFFNARKNLKRRNELKQILISFGGSDPSNETYKALTSINNLEKKYIIDVIVGSNNPNKKQIMKLCLKIPFCNFYEQVDNISKYMKKADLAIGGGGVTTWERCCLGLPTIVTSLSRDQKKITEELSKIECVINLGTAKKSTKLDYVNALNEINLKKLRKISKKCLALVDGKGAKRATKKILQTIN